MRLNAQQQQQLLATVRQVAGGDAHVWLYGSRMDDARRGGDVDLLVQSTPPLGLLARAGLQLALEQQLGLPVDVLAAPHGPAQRPFVAIAQATGARLTGP